MPVIGWLLRLPSPKPNATARHESQGGASVLPILLIALFFFLAVGAEGSFGYWIYSYAVETGLESETRAAYLNAAFWGALTLGRLLGIPIAARLSPRTILLGDLVVCGVSVGILLLWPHSLIATWGGVLGAGLSIASLFATTMSLAERMMPITGQVTGWFLIGSGAGTMALPWLIGQLFEPLGPRVMMYLVMADVLVAIGVLFAMALPKKGRVAQGV